MRIGQCFRPVFLTSVAVGPLVPAVGQTSVLTPSSFVENIEGSRPVEGNPFWGIQSGSGGGRIDLDSLRMLLPPGNQPWLCLDVETQDGKYWAAATYQLSATARLLVQRVAFPTRYKAVLKAYSIRDVGLRAYVTADCGDSRNTARVYVPVLLSADAGLAGGYLLLVNARTPGVDVSVYHREAKRRFDCKRDTLSPSQVTFDTECLIDIAPNLHSAVLVIIRRHFEDQTQTQLRAYFP